MASRRAKKGPGRRPQSDKRRRFMQLRERGWSIAAAAREVGVSRTAGHNWASGYKVYRNGSPVAFVPGLDRLAVREINARFLSVDDRIAIADLHHAGMSIRGIATRIGRAASTVSRELRRGAARDDYRPFAAQRAAVSRRARPRARKITTMPALAQIVADRLAEQWSPQQISRHLKQRFLAEPAMQQCAESIYRAVYQPGSQLRVVPRLSAHRASPLRTGRDHRKAHTRTATARKRFAQPMLSITDRPFDPADRTAPGHWEGDLIIGKDQKSAIGTLVERHTRLVRLLHLPARDSDSLVTALKARMSDLPSTLLRSITWDQGTEMAGHLKITEMLGCPVYFADPHSPWQRGSNENTNGLLRGYFPKGTALAVHGVAYLRAVEVQLNDRPRHVLGDRTPATLWHALLASAET